MAWTTKHECVGNTARTPDFNLPCRIVAWQAGDARRTAHVKVILHPDATPIVYPAPAVGLPA